VLQLLLLLLLLLLGSGVAMRDGGVGAGGVFGGLRGLCLLWLSWWQQVGPVLLLGRGLQCWQRERGWGGGGCCSLPGG
jgi:hypothetical protein